MQPLSAKEHPMKKLISLALGALFVMSAAAQTPAVSGEVIKLDKLTSRITLKHGGIKNLDDMPPMTMVFRARDPKMLDAVAVGDKVRFSAEKIDGNFTVTSLTK